VTTRLAPQHTAVAILAVLNCHSRVPRSIHSSYTIYVFIVMNKYC
jgi:hypothetical protein